MDGFDVLMYAHDGEEYFFLQSVGFKSKLPRSISLTGNHQYLAIGPANTLKEVIVFKKN